MITGYQVADQALTYLGVPFHHQGRNRFGLDCAGLVIVVAHDLGISDFDITGYKRQPDPMRFLQVCSAHMDQVKDIQVGCVLTLRFRGVQMHMGIALPNSLMIHSLYDHGVITSTIEQGTEWRNRVTSVWQYRGVTYG